MAVLDGGLRLARSGNAVGSRTGVGPPVRAVHQAPLIGHVVGGGDDARGVADAGRFDPATGRVTGRGALRGVGGMLTRRSQAVIAAEDLSAGACRQNGPRRCSRCGSRHPCNITNELSCIITAEHGKVLAACMGRSPRGLEVIQNGAVMPPAVKASPPTRRPRASTCSSFRELLGRRRWNHPRSTSLAMVPPADGAHGHRHGQRVRAVKLSDSDPSASRAPGQDVERAAGLPGWGRSPWCSATGWPSTRRAHQSPTSRPCSRLRRG